MVNGALAQPVLSEELRKNERQVLLVWLDGGMSQLESWDPKPRTRYGGPLRAIPTAIPGLHVSELMPRVAQRMQHLSLVRSMKTERCSLAMIPITGQVLTSDLATKQPSTSAPMIGMSK